MELAFQMLVVRYPMYVFEICETRSYMHVQRLANILLSSMHLAEDICTKSFVIQ